MHYGDFSVCSFFNFGSLWDSFTKYTPVEHTGKQANRNPQQNQNPQCNKCSNQHIKYIKAQIFLPRLAGVGGEMSLRQLQIDPLPSELENPAELVIKNVKQTLTTAGCTVPPLASTVYQQEKGMEIALKTMEPRLLLCTIASSELPLAQSHCN